MYGYQDGGTMAGGGGRSPFQITLRASERRWLKALTRRGTAQYRQVLRAQIVLLAATGWTNAGIARKLGLAPNTAGKWRKRFFQEGFDGFVTASGLAVRVCSRPLWSWPPRRSPASCPPPVG
jgi:Homeodomain-like domain